MTQVSQIASFRLTQAHRADILKAIIQKLPVTCHRT